MRLGIRMEFRLENWGEIGVGKDGKRVFYSFFEISEVSIKEALALPILSKPICMHMQPSKKPFDQLLAEARKGSQSAIGDLMESFGEYLHSVARRQLGSRLCGRVSPSDLVQDTFLAACRSFESFDGTEANQFGAWLRAILSRKISSAFELHIGTSKRGIFRESGGIVLDEADKTLHSREKSPGEIASRNEETLIIQRLLAELPEEYCKVIQWRNFENIQFSEIANRLGKTSGATRLVWLRAMKMLKKIQSKQNEGGP